MSSTKRASLIPQAEGTQPEEVLHISSFVLVKKGGQVLLLKRVKPERLKGSWCLPGAVINYGEDPGAAALRILKEQPGEAATSLKLLDVQSYGDKHWDLCFVFEADAPEPVKLGEEFDAAQYFDLSNLPPELREGHKEVLDMSRSRRII
ncbi:MAG: NUDIX domain-containing protein [Nitrososphaerota archaeon]|nr:NUDIX domain-containing protein [Nitrososphaerota archaeon]MDG6966385.1 NUDIX domain-containing protein [Nitrososphaerota archaeon]MDG6968590.1 NUDIX domain-containing protein [Nitrososphaerota archaeon]MDG6979420.1 NUDIX domain-containing protein [Nitrososphaerota archaeon]MDG7021272.1 NUDIX domain-containing protein [Nitrososphaerota archaeon]